MRSTPFVSNTQIQDEIQDQIVWYRKEVERKEKLIDDLRKSEVQYQTEQRDYQLNMHDSLVNEYRVNAEQARDELATTIAKMQSIEQDMKELKHKLTVTNSDYSELREENTKLKENNNRQSILINSMRSNILLLEEKITKSEIEIHSSKTEVEELKVQKSSWESEVTKYKEIILELEVLKSSLVSEKGDSTSKRRELYISVLSALGESSAAWDSRIPDDFGALSAKVEQLRMERDSASSEMTSLRAQISKYESLLEQSETEVKAGRETIMRLVAETEKLHQSETDLKVQLASIDGEKSAACSTIEKLQFENGALHSTISERSEHITTIETEIETLKAKILSLTSEHSTERDSYETLKSTYEKLRENIAALLSCSFQFVDKTDDSIVIRLREFLNDYKSRKFAMEALETKQRELTSCLADERQKYESLLEKLAAQKTTQDSSTSASGSSALHSERVKFLEFIEKLSHLLKMEKITGELGLDVNSDAILHRVKSLVEKEDSSLAEKTSTIYQLQRKVKHFKEELESKELHLDMLRKKIATLEEKSAGKVELFKEKEEQESKIKKFERLNEKLRGQLGDCRVQITSLKAEIADINALKLKQVEKDDEIRILVDKLDHLEKIRNKQAKQLAGLKQELKYVDHEARSTTNLKEENISQLSDQLTHAKRALEEVAKRERQLVEFRSLVAKILGMDVCALTVPDYEIISKLERLIHHHHVETVHHPATGNDLDNFWEGYERAKERLTQKKKPTQTAW